MYLVFEVWFCHAFLHLKIPVRVYIMWNGFTWWRHCLEDVKGRFFFISKAGNTIEILVLWPVFDRKWNPYTFGLYIAAWSSTAGRDGKRVRGRRKKKGRRVTEPVEWSRLRERSATIPFLLKLFICQHFKSFPIIIYSTSPPRASNIHLL